MRYWNRRSSGSLVTISSIATPSVAVQLRVAPDAVEVSMPENQVEIAPASVTTAHT